jgi:hypothetical protein
LPRHSGAMIILNNIGFSFLIRITYPESYRTRDV